MSSPNADPPAFRDPGRVPPTGRSLPTARRFSPPAQQPVPASWRSRMVSLNRTCTKSDPAPLPRHDPVNGYRVP